MVPTPLTGEGDCSPAIGESSPPAIGEPSPPVAFPPLRAQRRPFDTVPSTDWDALAAANPAATPFSRWAMHRAWWDGYGAGAHEETLVIVPAGAPPSAAPRAIVPLMHRHAVEAGDLERRTTIRHRDGAPLIPIPADCKVVYFGASYHADYATLLADPADMPAVADAVADYLGHGGDPSHPAPWDAVDLRRFRATDPALTALEQAFARREAGCGWRVDVEQEDVCPVVTLPAGATIDDYLATLGKKERHEIRRKVRRAEAAGEVQLIDSPDPVAGLPEFIDLHQRRWGDLGLFPDTPGGRQSRVFATRLFELFGTAGPLRLSFLSVGGKRIGAGITFETPDAISYYNAGLDPDARELSPGVLLVERYVRRALERGIGRLDFLRGDEAYKYEWGARDEPIVRVLVRRTRR